MPELTKKERMAMPRTDIPMRAPIERTEDFDEVNIGFTAALAVLEASRCLDCRRPICVDACPVGIQINEFVRLIAEGDFAAASSVVKTDNVLPAICGRVCPQENQCEGACVLDRKDKPIAIGALERFIADNEREGGPVHVTVDAEPTGHKVAIIGSGPAGLACAGDLIRAGHSVTVFEALHELGGVLIYGIPSFRLPKDIVRAEVDQLASMGVDFETDVLVGASVTIEELFDEEGYDAVFVGTGAGLPRFLGVPGEDLIGVYSANEFLTRVNLMHAGSPASRTPVYDLSDRPVVVVGGGNTAVDAARTALRLGAGSVSLLYRRSEEEMPARAEEIEHAVEEGVKMRFLVNPTAFTGEEGWLRGVVIQQMQLGEPDESGRRRPIAIEGTEEHIDADVAIVAVGNAPNPIIAKATPELDTTRWGTVVVDEETGATSMHGVFAGGDIATGGATVILALAAGRKAAKAISEYLVEAH